jgi:hypothetical protein
VGKLKGDVRGSILDAPKKYLYCGDGPNPQREETEMLNAAPNLFDRVSGLLIIHGTRADKLRIAE